jgi:hypothetical protein
LVPVRPLCAISTESSRHLIMLMRQASQSVPLSLPNEYWACTGCHPIWSGHTGSKGRHGVCRWQSEKLACLRMVGRSPHNTEKDKSISRARGLTQRPPCYHWLAHPGPVFLEWSRPDLEQADIVLKAFIAEIRERDETGSIYLGLGWPELLDPEMAQALALQVDGVYISGGERKPPNITTRAGLAGELELASYFGTMAGWIFRKPTEIEIGWGMLDNIGNNEETIEGFKRLGGQGVAGANWISLTDPEPALYSHPPWVLRPGLERLGLIDGRLEPKEEIESLLEGIGTIAPRDDIYDFIDISKQEYLDNPDIHLSRLWDHFRK